MGTLVGPTLPKTHHNCECHPPQSHCQGQTYTTAGSTPSTAPPSPPSPPLIPPLHKQDIWWSNGAQEMQTSKWNLELVLISNLPA